MTSRDRILATLNRETTDRLPVDLWHTPEIGVLLREYCDVDNNLEAYKSLDLDKIVWVSPSYQVTHQEDGEFLRNLWGVPIAKTQAGEAVYDEYAGAPMDYIDSPSQLDNYPYWPDPDQYDYISANDQAKDASNHFAVIGPWVSLFEIYCMLRGLEQSMIDLAMMPELVEATLDRIESIQSKMMRNLFEKSKQYYDLCFVSDDIAGQQSLLMSPDMWAEHLQPRLVRWCDLIHSYEIKVLYHTDGAAEPLIGDLIDCGIDVLNPIQHACSGMEPDALATKYGDRVIFHGGVDNQAVLPHGTPDDVREEVLMLNSKLRQDGQGYICCSCHNVQAGTPIENVIAMIEQAQACP